MKNVSVIFIFCTLCALSLLSCVGIATPQPAANLPVTVEGDKTPTPELFDYAIEYSPAGATATYQAKFGSTPTPRRTPTYTLEEQGIVATAFAHMGDKAPNLMLEKISKLGPVPGYNVYFQQTHYGILVHRAYTIISVRPEGIETNRSTYLTGIQVPSITPTIALSEAITIAVEKIRIEGDYQITHNTRLFVDKVPTKRVYKDPQYILKWAVELDTGCPSGIWEVRINAHTGDILNLFEKTTSDPPITNYGCPTPLPVPRPTEVPAPTTP